MSKIAAFVLLAAVCASNAQIINPTFRCNNGRSIPGRWKCDADNDCGDWSDEAACTSCTARNYLCQRMQKCIPKTYVCDGDDDCGDGSDETNCNTCSRGQFLCANRKCIPYANQCNGRDDCGDNSDENSYDCRERNNQYQQQVVYNWGQTTARLPPRVPVTTPRVVVRTTTQPLYGMYRCGSGEIIPNSYRCDGYFDCGDGSDEYNCRRN